MILGNFGISECACFPKKLVRIKNLLRIIKLYIELDRFVNLVQMSFAPNWRCQHYKYTKVYGLVFPIKVERPVHRYADNNNSRVFDEKGMCNARVKGFTRARAMFMYTRSAHGRPQGLNLKISIKRHSCYSIIKVHVYISVYVCWFGRWCESAQELTNLIRIMF